MYELQRTNVTMRITPSLSALNEFHLVVGSDTELKVVSLSEKGSSDSPTTNLFHAILDSLREVQLIYLS